jgi:hypothetical protein
MVAIGPSIVAMAATATSGGRFSGRFRRARRE